MNNIDAKNKYKSADRTPISFDSFINQQINSILNISNFDLTHENANMNSLSPAGQMMNIASFMTKQYALSQIINPEFAHAHVNGYIHIHDMDYYPSKTTTCLQYDLHKLFTNGFNTEKGFIREPQSIGAYASLAAIVFQTNQNEQHGGQAIPAFDYFMAPGVLKSFVKHLYANVLLYLSLEHRKQSDIFSKKELINKIHSIDLNDTICEWLCTVLEFSETIINDLWMKTYYQVERDTFQAMESFIHNLNTMHSRGGNQVVFSSINYGTDTSAEGRMVIKQLLLATQKGLGHGETPIFPIQIFKVKEGISYSAEDIQKAIKYHGDFKNHDLSFTTPNFDLLIEACITNSTRLFPNFVFLDAPFNVHEDWNASDPQNYLHEVATMGCRTRVFENVNGLKTSVGRGNLSFTSINLPRLAIETIQELKSNFNNNGSQSEQEKLITELFLNKVEQYSDLVARQLFERYKYQISANKNQFSFMLKNKLWKYDSSEFETLKNLNDVFNQGTLAIGFIGGHNAMHALFGTGHGQSDVAYETLTNALKVMNKVADHYKQKYNLNFSVIATPAEGLSGRFTKMDRKRFGVISGVNDRDYYVNSFHIDVQEDITIYDKIAKEAPFHALTLGGHITYVELDSNLKFNISAILRIIQVMFETKIGYGSINHPVDTCLSCHHTGVISNDCVVCGSSDIRRIRRITGYLTGSLESWNEAKKAEERDRVKHGYNSRNR